MRLLDFAEKSGFILIDLGEDGRKHWSGRYAYSTKDHPNCTVCGFKNPQTALKGWFVDTFGEYASKQLIKTLKDKK